MDERTYFEEYIDEIEIINTHDHTMAPEQARRRAQKESYLYDVLLANNNSGFLSYLPDERWRTTQFDFGDALGNHRDSCEASPAQLWEKLAPVIWRGKASPHFRMFMEGCRDLFGLDFAIPESEEQWTIFSQRMQASNQREDWYDHVLRQKAHIEKTLVVGRADPRQVEREYFLPLHNLGDFLSGFDSGVLQKLEQQYGRRAESFADFEELLRHAVKTAKQQGVVAIKDMQAYRRFMNYKNVTRNDARKAFECVSHNGWAMKSISGEDITRFQDYTMHLILSLAGEYGLPVQIHTGSPAPTDQSNPLLLIDLIESHPETDIVVLHCGGAYYQQFVMTAKYASHVYLDLAWLLTGFPGPSGTRRLLGDWLELVPWDKFTWGADCAVVEETYGTFLTARRVLAQVLADKVGEGFISRGEGEQIARMILRENAKKLYHI